MADCYCRIEGNCKPLDYYKAEVDEKLKNNKQVQSIAQLRALAEPGPFSGFIKLNGDLQSYKTIWYCPGLKIRKPWKILNGRISDSEDGIYERMTQKEFKNSFIGHAIILGAFYGRD